MTVQEILNRPAIVDRQTLVERSKVVANLTEVLKLSPLGADLTSVTARRRRACTLLSLRWAARQGRLHDGDPFRWSAEGY